MRQKMHFLSDDFCEHSGPPVQVSDTIYLFISLIWKIPQRQRYDTVSVWCLGRGILADKKHTFGEKLVFILAPLS